MTTFTYPLDSRDNDNKHHNGGNSTNWHPGSDIQAVLQDPSIEALRTTIALPRIPRSWDDLSDVSCKKKFYLFIFLTYVVIAIIYLVTKLLEWVSRIVVTVAHVCGYS